MSKTKQKQKFDQKKMIWYQERIKDKMRRIAELEEAIKGWKEIQQVNMAMTAALLKSFDGPVQVMKADIDEALKSNIVVASINANKDGYILEVKKREE